MDIRTDLIMTTSTNVEGRKIREYVGLVTGEAILGSNFIRDFFAGITDIIGGRSAAYEASMREAKETAVREMVNDAKKIGADAIIAIDLDYESINLGGDKGSMLMVSVSGTAVRLD